MTIYRVKDRNGHILRYQARIERKATGKLRASFPTLEEAVAWVSKLNEDLPCQSAAWAHRGVKVRDLQVNGADGRGRLKILNSPMMLLHGCTLIRGTGRCPPLDKCSHYLGCLDAADKAGWEGWSLKGRDITYLRK